MIIKLPWVEDIDTLHLPNNFENKVKESFSKFTQGTVPSQEKWTQKSFKKRNES